MKKLSTLFLVIFLLLCSTDKINTSGTVDDTETVIAIRGRVLTKAGDGVPLVITKLVKTGFADTTDADGNYAIVVSKMTLQSSGISLDSIKSDTVQYSKDNSIFTWETVTTWKITLPDVYLVQRNISGKISIAVPQCKKFEAIISNLTDTTQKRITIPLWYNVLNTSFSGFAYFVTAAGLQDYSLYVNLFVADSLILSGRSQTIRFNSQAGDIELPSFSPFNAIPIPNAGKDTVVSINDTIRLHGSAVDSFGGTIARWEWSINANPFAATATGDSIIVAPKDSVPSYTCVLRVTEADNNRAIDTMNVIVCKDAPIVNAGIDTTVTINTPVRLAGSCTQQFGTIVMYKWDFNGDSIYDDSSATTSALSYTYTHETTYNAKLYVRDDDGNEATDIRSVTVGNNAPVITSIRPDTIISIKDSITLRATAVDNDGSIKEYAWDGNGDGIFEYISATQINTGYRFNGAGVYKAIVRVIDDDNKGTKDTVIVTVLQDVPIANAGKDTIVSINDLIRLHGSAKDGFGNIVKWEWDLGNSGTFIQTSASDTNILGSSTENLNYQCVLRVTDDDGNIAYDTIKISVLTDLPIANAGNDTIIFINDIVNLRGNAKDSFGVIVKWEWDLGNTGTFIQTSTPDTSLKAPASEFLNITCILRVTDDDGNSAKDTILIRTCAPVTDIDGNIYKTIKIGNQVWLAENLKTTKYNDGTSIPMVTDNDTWLQLKTPAYCWNENNIDNKSKYGALYNWYVVKPNNPQKITPTGWHVPTDTEWTTLTNYLIENGYNWDKTITGNKIAKALSTQSDWQVEIYNEPNGFIGQYLSINNRSGFSALPGGGRGITGQLGQTGMFFLPKNGLAQWWSNSTNFVIDTPSVSAYGFSLARYERALIKKCDMRYRGYSLRLIRD